ncbi:hypothetical protein HRI_001432400 [Hibiscus trionum]|uniref:Dof zinc finger protein n=1 Tax=Hibiscus trionum TaxID=183268 RepID=A0A9W7LVP1_HIBTR|nr:hypothetical protein HRI_001432400 [Hibiscus trionum]
MLSSCEKTVAGATISSTSNEWSQKLMEKPSQEQQQQALKCPRCDSSNTKFCYYNYSLSQPRHFCKSCKRYWTRGGTLRNVPVGGGCRKNKRVKRPTPSSSPLSSTSSTHHVNNNNNNNINNNNPLFYGLSNDASADIINFPYQPCLSDFPNNPLLSSYSNMFGFSSSSTPTIASLLASTLNQHKIINGGVKNTEPLALPPFLDQLQQIGWSTNMGSWHDPTSIGFGSSVTSLI